MEHILKEKGKKERLEREVTALLKAYSLAVPDDRAMKIKEVGLFQAIKSAIAKTTETGKESQELNRENNQSLRTKYWIRHASENIHCR